MKRMTVGAAMIWSLLASAAFGQHGTIGPIDFFGYQGLDVAKVRAALPVHTGDRLSNQTKAQIEAAVLGIIGKKPTGVAELCCDQQGRTLIYIGLPGGTYKPIRLNPAPQGADTLPPEIVSLNDRTGDALSAAVQKGGVAAEEDDSQGYARCKDPATRALQLQERAWALEHSAEVLTVLRSSSDAKQRQVASEVLGYARQSHEQMAALVHASSDPDWIVRNNSTRALGVLVRSNPLLATEIEPDTFIAMLGSGDWSDHNKAVALLDAMTLGRDPKLLAKIRQEALEPLIEMATWTEAPHAFSARLVLGRVGGIPEEKLPLMAFTGPVDEIVAAARGK